VTTPPSKGLVVELYLIYFGLAQSFVVKKAFSFLGMAILGGALTLGFYKMLYNDQVIIERSLPAPVETLQSNFNPTYDKANSVETATDFTVAAERTVHAVVHVKNTAIRTQTDRSDLFLEEETDRESTNKLEREAVLLFLQMDIL
jgi:hypothetical protein